MKEWNKDDFENYINPKTYFVINVGLINSGKTEIGKDILEKEFKIKYIDCKEVEANIKKKKGTEEEPFEGDVTYLEVADEIN
jgi:hypothetical protein